MPEIPMRRMSREGFEALLLEIRNGANMAVVDLAVEEIRGADVPDDAVMADVRPVWHAAEVALGILRPGYLPKREALEDVRAMLAWVDGTGDDWLAPEEGEQDA